MEDHFLNHCLRLMSRDLFSNVLRQELRNLKCDLCKNSESMIDLFVCVFCDKSYCSACGGKKNTKICKKCNNLLAANVSRDILRKLTLAENKTIANNYNIDIKDCIEKEDIIDLILLNFNKSISDVDYRRIDVENARENMDKMKREEIERKKELKKQEEENARICLGYGRVSTKDESELEIEFQEHHKIEFQREEVQKMSVKNLKAFLNEFEQDFTGIIEKPELIRKVLSVYDCFRKYEGKKTKQSDKDIPQHSNSECVICMDSDRNTVLMNCNHMVCCWECANQLTLCPICKGEIVKILKVFV